MKTYQKVGEVIELVRAYHHRLYALYKQLEDSEASNRLRMLIDYLGRHEQRFEEALRRYEAEGRRDILDTWCQFVPDDDLSLAGLRPVASNLAEVVSTALALDGKLVRFYAHMAQALPQSSEARGFFTTLAAQEEQEEAALSVTAEMIREI